MTVEQQTLALPAVQPETSSSLTESLVMEALLKWTDAIKTLDPQAVANLYAETAVLWGTIAGHRIEGRAGIARYFHTLLGDKSTGKVTLGAPPAITIMDPAAWAISDYEFEFGRNNATKFALPARYTFIFQQSVGGELEIVHQHSSPNPQFPAREL